MDKGKRKITCRRNGEINMKVALVNGSPHKNGCTYTALSEAAKTLNEEGIETEIFGSVRKLCRGVLRVNRV